MQGHGGHGGHGAAHRRVGVMSTSRLAQQEAAIHEYEKKGPVRFKSFAALQMVK